MTLVQAFDTASGLERKSPSEGADVDEIVRGMLAIQAQAASSGKRPLSRGTHAKGICVRAEFEVFDLGRTIRDPDWPRAWAKALSRDLACIRQLSVSPTPTAGIGPTKSGTSAQCLSPSTSRRLGCPVCRESISR